MGIFSLSLNGHFTHLFDFQKFSPGYIKSNAHQFLDNNWIDVVGIKAYIASLPMEAPPLGPPSTAPPSLGRYPTSAFVQETCADMEQGITTKLGWQLSDTTWDPADQIVSEIYQGEGVFPFKVNGKTSIERLERIVNKIPSVWPVYPITTGIIVDLRGDEFNVRDGEGKLYRIDTLIKDKDEDPWGDLLVQVIAKLHFLNVVKRSGCQVKDPNGMRCEENLTLHKADLGHSYVVCTRKFDGRDKGKCPATAPDHLYVPVQPSVDVDVLAKLLTDEELGEEANTAPCDFTVPPAVGGKQKFCESAHIVDRRYKGPTPMRKLHCNAKRYIYVPDLDIHPDVRLALVVHLGVPHSHPLPYIQKMTVTTKKLYEKCIDAFGPVGATQRKVDNAPSTMSLLNELAPAEGSSRLKNKRRKRDQIHNAKLLAYPDGLDLKGVYDLYLRESRLPPRDRYIHRFQPIPDNGGTLIVTGEARLVDIVHEVDSGQGDCQYKRTRDSPNAFASDKLQEYELSTYHPGARTAVTMMRVYMNRFSANDYKLMFDLIRDGGTLLGIISDMEIAHVQGLAMSFFETVDPEYIGHIIEKPLDMVPFCVRLCGVYFLRGAHKLEGKIPESLYRHLVNIPNLQSQVDVDQLSQDIRVCPDEDLQNWWDHKLQHPWIIPALVRSLTRMDHHVWDVLPANTNVVEAQHRWTNLQTGIQLTPVEAIELARQADMTKADAIQDVLRSGVFDSSSTGLAARMSESIRRGAARARAAVSSSEASAQLADIKQQIALEMELRRDKNNRRKEIQTRLVKIGKAQTDERVALVEELNSLKTVRVESLARAALLAKDKDLLNGKHPSASAKHRSEAATSSSSGWVSKPRRSQKKKGDTTKMSNHSACTSGEAGSSPVPPVTTAVGAECIPTMVTDFSAFLGRFAYDPTVNMFNNAWDPVQFIFQEADIGFMAEDPGDVGYTQAPPSTFLADLPNPGLLESHATHQVSNGTIPSVQPSFVNGDDQANLGFVYDQSGPSSAADLQTGEFTPAGKRYNDDIDKIYTEKRLRLF
ncbi:hypothetical protein V5O48_015610 [Marasmius crinis-equi]|uniref:Uncharacterized protein n=1 Tax=Marasmius crinis-equi TaxID=585013 RepID=A0ABR3EUE8_9AGAR